ncbi:MAG: adenosylhomocysteinase [Chloroflexota bacterium]|jgi:adenosylhomocysteinase
MQTRVQDLSLTQTADAADGWLKVCRPVLSHFGELISRADFAGRNVACFQHVRPETPLILLPLVRAGAAVSIAAVNPDSTDDMAAATLARGGVNVWAWSGMTEEDRRVGLSQLAAEPADAISDMGGELIAAVAERDGPFPAAALEATTSGISHLAGRDIPFPVFDWNDIALKDRIHNRYHVGMQAWPVISDITGLAIYGRSVLVVGFGPVGQGVATQARALGAIVSVAELDPVRALEAQQLGLRTVSLEEGLASCTIVVTATGRQGVIGPEQLARTRAGAILANVGHGNREIDLDWLEDRPHQAVRPHIERYELEDHDVFLLNRGSLVNLSGDAGIEVEELFDPFAAVMLRGLAWILEGGAAGAPHGIQPYPAHLEREIADLLLSARA